MNADGYDEHAHARWVAEPPKRAGRSAFARDRARVMHSSALRRLAAKTQVVVPWTNDFVRNRLTHSLEVAQVGRELGKALGCDPDVVDTACLAHDLGHPPYGHNGEAALDTVAAGIGGFEGNAQTLRVLTRLEAKTFDARGGSAGLNLTRASLDAATKYPWPRAVNPAKYGVYDAEDGAVFGWLRQGAPAERRCLEAQVMDWADDVAYSVHDVEDAVQAGKVDLAALRDRPGGAPVLEVARSSYAPSAEPAALQEALDRLVTLEWWPSSYDGTRRSLAALKDMTSQLIGRFCTAAEQATHAAYGGGALTRYAADLVVPAETLLEVAVLKGIAAHFVMQAEERVAVMAEERALLTGLVGALCERPEALTPAFRADWTAAGDDGARLRVVVDQVASLTDTSARLLNQRLLGGV